MVSCKKTKVELFCTKDVSKCYNNLCFWESWGPKNCKSDDEAQNIDIILYDDQYIKWFLVLYLFVLNYKSLLMDVWVFNVYRHF